MDIAARRKRSSEAWGLRAPWEPIWNEAYDYVLPNRRPGDSSKTKRRSAQIYDMTAPNAYMYAAGKLQRQWSPPGQRIPLEAGPLVAQALGKDELKKFNAALSRISDRIHPYFLTGGYDAAMHEFCLELGVSNAYLMPLKGPSIEDPLRFVCIPHDECACTFDGYSRLSLISWKKRYTRSQIMSLWPKGKYSDEFKKLATDKPNDKILVYQDFSRLDRGWEFAVYLENTEDLIDSTKMLAQPVAVGRPYVVPGETYSRGPVLAALPTIKTQNTAQELTLKSAAIAMLGIWAYRAGGTFNPDTVNFGPGEMWGMQSTGGVMGPDVERLDKPNGNLQVSQMVLSNGADQIRDALGDTRLTDDGKTPDSATEVAAKMRQGADMDIGVFGRLSRDVPPVVMARSMEILHEWGLLDNLMSLNELLVAVSVPSPMAISMRASEVENASNFKQYVESMVGPEEVGFYINQGRMIDEARKSMIVSPIFLTTEDEKKQFRDDQKARELQTMASEALTKSAPSVAANLTAPEAVNA